MVLPGSAAPAVPVKDFHVVFHAYVDGALFTHSHAIARLCERNGKNVFSACCALEQLTAAYVQTVFGIDSNPAGIRHPCRYGSCKFIGDERGVDLLHLLYAQHVVFIAG